jgi:hypothetical protein
MLIRNCTYSNISTDRKKLYVNFRYTKLGSIRMEVRRSHSGFIPKFRKSQLGLPARTRMAAAWRAKGKAWVAKAARTSLETTELEAIA